jgi:hypothetical protein
VALALGLAFGLGGRDTAAMIVRGWYERGQQAAPKMQQAADSLQRQADAGQASAPTRSGASASDGAETSTVRVQPAS